MRLMQKIYLALDTPERPHLSNKMQTAGPEQSLCHLRGNVNKPKIIHMHLFTTFLIVQRININFHL